MTIRFFLICWFSLNAICLTFGQQEADSLKLKKHYIFYNFTSIVGFEGSSLQFGYNYRYKPWIDFQLELGFLSDNLINARLPYDEYVGFRIRPQIKLFEESSLRNDARFYGGVLLSYQHLTFKENRTFNIDDNFIQNITYQGTDNTYAWYIVGGVDGKITSRLQISISMGFGQVIIRSKVNEGEIPENAILQSDCILFCDRSEKINEKYNRLGTLLELRFGYLF